MVKENISVDFRLKNLMNDLMNELFKKVCGALNNFELFLILFSSVSGYVSISAFSSSIGIPIGIASQGRGNRVYVCVGGSETPLLA